MEDTDIEVIERNLLARFFELAKKEHDLEAKKDAKLTAEVDKIQSALKKIRGAKNKS